MPPLRAPVPQGAFGIRIEIVYRFCSVGRWSYAQRFNGGGSRHTCVSELCQNSMLASDWG